MRLIDADRFLRETRFQEGVYPQKTLRREIGEQPTVDAVPVVHGRWICLEQEIGLYECSECGHRILRAECKFCPNCGAKMDGGENNE